MIRSLTTMLKFPSFFVEILSVASGSLSFISNMLEALSLLML